MGIPSYFSYIVKNHSNIIRKLSSNPIKVDNLYLDCNSIIYDAFYKMDISTITENISNIIISNVITNIKEYIHCLNPTNLVFIAFDGVAPLAKIEQQRCRRFKSVYQNSVSKKINKNTDVDKWNTTLITPGTIFMNTLNKNIAKAFKNPKEFQLNQIIVSGSNIYGEGEHKIFQYIRNNANEDINKNTIIYGLDADLIMLAINHLPITPNIYLFRETPEFIKSIQPDLEPNENYILDIPELSNAITMDMNNGEELTTKQQKNRIYDYIFLCFFLGNDFMPHFPALNIRTGGIHKILQAYKTTIGNTNENLTDGTIIYWKNVSKLVTFLAENEEVFFKEEHKLRDKKEKYKLPNITPEDQINVFMNIPTFERSMERYINPYKINWQTRYYKSLFNIEINSELREKISMNYLEGLEWTMKYYTTGCPDWRWKYNYAYPPLLQDLLHFIPYHNVDLISNKPENPVTDLVQLSYVLPKQFLHFLPKNLEKSIIAEKYHWYKKDCDFIWAYCKYFWESHPKLPEIDIEELETFIKNII
jgi:5'-3' exonuclease